MLALVGGMGVVIIKKRGFHVLYCVFVLVCCLFLWACVLLTPSEGASKKKKVVVQR